MFNWFRYIFLFSIVLFICFSAAAQLAMPDYVYIGTTKHYFVSPSITPGSTYTWRINGIPLLSSTTNEIDITWNNPGNFLLEIQEQSAEGCLGPVNSGNVIVGTSLPTAVIIGSASICPGQNATLIFFMTGVPPYTIHYTDGSNTYTLTGIINNLYLLTLQPQISCTYTLVSVTDASGFTNTGSGAAIFTVHAVSSFIVTGGGFFCPNGPGAVVGLSGSSLGVQYQLIYNGQPQGIPAIGTGQTINFGNISVPGLYQASGMDMVNGCTTSMYGSAFVTSFPSQTIYNVTGGGECCFGCTAIHVGLSGSQLGVTYYASINNTVFSNLPGSGGSLDFGLITQSGSYTVSAIDDNGCIIKMNGQVEAIIHPKPEATLLSSNISICAGDSAMLLVNTPAGTSPFTYTFITADSSFSIIDSSCSFMSVWVHPVDTTTYTLQYVNDAYCVNYGSGTSTVNVISCLPNPSYSVSGYVQYNNASLTSMNNARIILYQNNLPIDTTTSDIIGYYHFDNLVPGNYQLSGSSIKVWGGVNSTDALMISSHFVHAITLQGINVIASDVNNSNSVNSLDALLAVKRFVQVISTFPAGDWAFEKPSFNIINNNVTIDIHALCYGDVNGSYQPSDYKQAPTVFLTTSGILEINSSESFEVPITTNLQQTPGAISLVMNYPAALFDLTYVKFDDPEISSFIFKAENGVLRIGWYATKEPGNETHESIIRLGFKSNSLNDTESDELNLNLGTGCEFADKDGNLIQHVILQTPRLVNRFPLPEVKIYPNPTNGNVQFVYSIPENGLVNIKLYDIVGKVVATLCNDIKEAGLNELIFNTSNLPQGIYTCRITVSGSTSVKILVGRMGVIR